MYGTLPKTGIAVISIGGVSIAYPYFAAGIAAVLIIGGIVLRITGRRKKLSQ